MVHRLSPVPSDVERGLSEQQVARSASGAVTMHDVAALAAVSVKTVSNVVNDYPHIRPETRQRVEQAISQLGYRVNASARNLRRGRTGVIGLALPELALPYFAELADSVIKAAESRSLTVLIEHTGGVRERELEVLQSQRRALTDGLLFSPLALGQDDADALDVGFPLVLLGERIFGGPKDHVTMANVDGAKAATQHLIERGAQRIAVIGAHRDERLGSAALRMDGYRQALAEAGLPLDPTLELEAGPWHRATGAAALQRAIDDGLQFDAVFGLNDTLALGALHVLHARGISVPAQVQVIGFDNIEETAFSLPTLTTLDPGREEIAREAVRLIEARIDGVAPQTPRLKVATHRIVQRDSTLLRP